MTAWPSAAPPTIQKSSAAPVFRGHALAIQSIRQTDEFILSGPYETGKTLAALWLLDSLMREYPRARAAMVRKIRATMDGTVLETWRAVIAIRGGVTIYGGERPEHYTYPNGARVWVGGLDNPGKSLSGERDFIYVNQAEELTEDDWQTLSTRATGRSGRALDAGGVPIGLLFGDCNPGPADHWILRREGLRLLPTTHRDNPTLYSDDGEQTARGAQTMERLNRLSGTQRKRGRDGQWIGAEGQYFETWDDDIHVIDPLPIGGDWHIWGALDYGFAHPLAFGVFGLDTLGNVHLMGEHVQQKRLIHEHAAAMRALLESLGLSAAHLRQIAAGHDCWASRGGDDPETIADKFKKAGFELTQATIDRVNGWQAIMGRLGRPADNVPPTLFIWRDCVRTIATMPSLPHDPSRPEDVKKLNADTDGRGGDDAADMLRYGVMAVPGLDSDSGFVMSYDRRGKR